MELLTTNQLNSLQNRFKFFRLNQNTLIADFVFSDFVTAFAFMSQVALVAERMNHHPNWSNVYNRVAFVLFTHDACGITQLDIDLADQIESFYLRYFKAD